MRKPIPMLSEFGDRIACVAQLFDVHSIILRQENCDETFIEIDCAYIADSGQRVATTVILPLGELITITDLYDLTPQKGVGKRINLSDLPDAID